MGTVVFDGNVISMKTAAAQKAVRLENLTIVFSIFFLLFPVSDTPFQSGVVRIKQMTGKKYLANRENYQL